MELPQDPVTLECLLAAKLAELERMAREAEEAVFARRAEILRDYSGRLSVQSARLDSLGLHEQARDARSLAAQVDAELGSLSARLPIPQAAPSTPVATASTQPQAKPSQAASEAQMQAQQHAAPVPQGEPAQTEPRAQAVRREPEQAAVEAQPSTPEDRAEASTLVEAIHNQFRMLSSAAADMDLEELKLRIEILAAEGHLLQDRFSFLGSQLNRSGDTLHLTFGGLTRICYDVLNPKGIRVAALKREMRTNWAKYIEDHRSRLDELLHRRDETRKRREAEEEARKRRAQLEAENERRVDAIKHELLELIAESEQDSYWSEDLRDLLEDYHHLSPKSTDSEITRALASHAGLFEGKQFRWLRKKLNPRSGETTALDSALEESLAGQVSALSKTRAFEQWRAWFAGKSATLVGGSRRDSALNRLKDFFQFAKLDWIENERTEAANTRRVEQAIKNGRYDLVFYLARFSSHSLQACVKDACHSSGVPFVLVERGYGVGACCRALERMGDMVRHQGDAK